MELLTILKIVTAIISIVLAFFGLFGVFTKILQPPALIMGIYQGYDNTILTISRIFGVALFLSLFDLKVIRNNLFILKSTKGKGIFCIL